MSNFYAIVLGLVQGITEFLPVSSFGHQIIIRRIWGISGDFSILFGIFLHLGTMLAMILVFRREMLSLIREWITLSRDLLLNLIIYWKNRRLDKKMEYVKIIRSKSRKFAVMVLLGTIPTFILGYFARHLVFIWGLSSVWPSIGILMTGIVLLVAGLSKAGGRKNLVEASLDQSIWLGIAQGLAVFPGISRYALTLSGGLFFGYSRSFAIKYSFILSIPAVLGGFFYELSEFSSRAMTSDTITHCLLGMLFAFFMGIFCIKIMIQLLRKLPLHFLAIYCFVAGFLTLFYNFQ